LRNKVIIGNNVIIRCNSIIGNGDDIIVIEKGFEVKSASNISTKLSN